MTVCGVCTATHTRTPIYPPPHTHTPTLTHTHTQGRHSQTQHTYSGVMHRPTTPHHPEAIRMLNMTSLTITMPGGDAQRGVGEVGLWVCVVCIWVWSGCMGVCGRTYDKACRCISTSSSGVVCVCVRVRGA
jgi:hypothetical protein